MPGHMSMTHYRSSTAGLKTPMVVDPAIPCSPAGPGPFLPKPRELYKPLEEGISPPMVNILTAEDGPYWKAV